jgi:YHS domain-containing protein
MGDASGLASVPVAMIRYFFIRLVVPLLLFLLLRSVLRSIFQNFRAMQQQPPQDSRRQATTTASPGGELKRDPVCGTYVSATTSLSRTVNGDVVYFCSKECRDRYKVA